MKKILKLLVSLFIILTVVLSCVSCDAISGLFGNDDKDGRNDRDHIDYVSDLKLDMSTTSLKQEVTVKSYIDGDTTHFNVPKSISDTGVLKARYLAVNTPESTGKIEEYGKKASDFTKAALKGAESIIIESDDEKWNVDSTGERYLVWIWYKTAGTSDYRNLNLELLQNGLAIASNSSQNRYGTLCMSAIDQAKYEKLYVYSGEKDPDMYYGDAVELTLKELRTNLEAYNGVKVAFNAVVTNNNNNGVYVESYDDETDMYYGMYIYYGFSLSGQGAEILKVGNECRIVGTLQYYETGGSYQIADVKYNVMKPKDPSNLQLISSGNVPSYIEIAPKDLVSGTKTLSVIVKGEDGNENITEKTFKYGDLVLGTSASMSGLKIKDVYTTSNGGDSDGAMTITCTAADGTEITVRTNVLLDAEGNLLTEEDFPIGATIDAKGIIDIFDGSHQLKVLSYKDVTVTK